MGRADISPLRLTFRSLSHSRLLSIPFFIYRNRPMSRHHYRQTTRALRIIPMLLLSIRRLGGTTASRFRRLTRSNGTSLDVPCTGLSLSRTPLAVRLRGQRKSVDSSLDQLWSTIKSARRRSAARTPRGSKSRTAAIKLRDVSGQRPLLTPQWRPVSRTDGSIRVDEAAANAAHGNAIADFERRAQMEQLDDVMVAIAGRRNPPGVVHE